LGGSGGLTRILLLVEIELLRAVRRYGPHGVQAITVTTQGRCDITSTVLLGDRQPTAFIDLTVPEMLGRGPHILLGGVQEYGRTAVGHDDNIGLAVTVEIAGCHRSTRMGRTNLRCPL